MLVGVLQNDLVQGSSTSRVKVMEVPSSELSRDAEDIAELWVWILDSCSDSRR